MNPLAQIDAVFFWLKDKLSTGGYYGYHNIENFVTRTPELKINITLLKEILKRLEADGYVSRMQPAGGGQEVYNVTFKGLVFDGYVIEDEEKKLSANIAKITVNNSQNLNRLTFWLVIFSGIAALYYAVELYKFFWCK
ncbi:hypothetical protein ACFOTA_00960 [Chitinophaga sp. GCM10012297]|uniref:Uncharacterized protein n=1 Tax=Chitinophaga chungangae TaxID=2821488 RepID=A0ABS3Y803_9BACT|nr:hypothetical protein [Chitinophaga chungangae]MBO9150761.1 hypothetical protein [Chitinophaga chungangae]